MRRNTCAPISRRWLDVTRGCCVIAALLAACGDDGAQTTAGGTTTSTTSTPSSGTVDPATTSTGTPDPTTTPTTNDATTADVTTTSPVSATGSTSGGSTDTGSSTGGPSCAEGTIVCDGDVAKVCDGTGGFESEEACPEVCVPELGCVACVPGEGVCDGAVASKCDAGGTWVDTLCDDVQGLTCEAGECVGACGPASLGASHIGCEFYSVIPTSAAETEFTFAIAVSNLSAEDADVTITRGGDAVVDILVPANSSEVVPLPWILDLMDASVASLVLVDGSYRIRSTRPVAVHQYTPLENLKKVMQSSFNEATLLMPSHVYGTDTLAIARNTFNGFPGAYVVVAREDGTTVTVTPSATGGIVRPGAGIAADGTGEVVLDAGDVLQVLSGVGGGEPNNPDKADITGTRVVSDKPVMVLGAHRCTFVPLGTACCCDPLIELNLPTANLGSDYLVTAPLTNAPNEDPFVKARVVRIVATTAGTTLTYDPPQDGAPSSLAKAGDYAEFQSDADFKISANFKIAVSEYHLSMQAGGGGAGDPAMTIVVPIEQYRGSYAFHAPTNYAGNVVTITAPSDAAVVLDGQPVAGFQAIGATGLSVARVLLANDGDGGHTVTGDVPFGVQVHGYGWYASYAFPGGLDLAVIP